MDQDECCSEVDDERPRRFERARGVRRRLSARRSAGGDAIAALARRGYVIAPTLAVLNLRSPPRVVAINGPGVVWCGVGLPTSRRPWKLSEQGALALDLSAYPQIAFASAHDVLRIRGQLRREGHGVD